MFMRLVGTLVLALGVLAFAGSAVAGNGNGNGNSGGKPSAGDPAPGNSADAPGQVKKDAPAADAAPAPTSTTTTAAPTEGVKPANDTAHDTRAAASSNETKEYGNGQTAGAIAISNGAAPSTTLHGPGNSQPHKASPCGGGHEVDVHALKGRRAGPCGGPGPAPHPGPTPAPPTSKPDDPRTPTAEDKPKPSANPDAKANPPAASPTAAGAEESGRVATASRGDADFDGVLATTARAGRSASLPFTGAPLWLAFLAGLLLVATGLALRQIRTAEATVGTRHDHTNRPRHAPRSSGSSIGGRAGR